MAAEEDIVTSMLGAMRQILAGGVLTDDAERMLEQKLRHEWGGQAVYVKKAAVDIEARDNDIRTRYNGLNRLELQATWNISRSVFYEIIHGN